MMNQTDAATAPPRESLWALTLRAGRGIRWYFTTLMGDRAYDTYVAHLARVHPGTAPLTERQFWRQKMAEQDANPGARCC